MDHTMFDHQVEALKDEFRVITWDERGFGETRAKSNFTYWDSADDAIALLDHLGIDQAVLGGMSQGGFLSMRAALRYPDRVKALVLISTAPDIDDEQTRAGYQQMVDGWVAGMSDQIAPVVAGIILGPEQYWEPWLTQWKSLDVGQLKLAADCLLNRDDISDRIHEIECPALVVHGSDDTAISLARAEKLRDGLPGCEKMVTVPGAHHAANLTHPAAVNPPLLDFLRAQR